ncbi:hypothetical protein [Candidatus Marimicrobium litorale]|uniref:Uncharacterized protein n=1 Tax=Candidatus Marimicrobium litorale TaxID=2518991 RepID=A0ABT3T132_9GAMM|nr:hypothetical protein [Candidatus Marimicrobium litorale]MCX2975971.1 hypothetical protein [Candidatus Marimicrobium litorale]
MKLIKNTDEYTIYQRRDGRYAVKNADRGAVNGDEKVRILLEEELIKAAAPAEPAAEVVEDAPAEDASADAAAEDEAAPADKSADE